MKYACGLICFFLLYCVAVLIEKWFGCGEIYLLSVIAGYMIVINYDKI